jgi:hypothetical protein
MIEEWIAKDPDHRGRVGSQYLLDGQGKASVYVIEDSEGPIMFVRQESEGNTTRLHTQFPPKDHRRIVEALNEAFPIVSLDARDRGFKEIVFESNSMALIRYMSRFGFRFECRAVL